MQPRRYAMARLAWSQKPVHIGPRVVALFAPVLFLTLFLGATLADAQSASNQSGPRDAAADQKIIEAIRTYYKNNEFDRAEAILRGVDVACEDRCSANVKANIWMYVGIVQGVGKGNQRKALDAFRSDWR